MPFGDHLIIMPILLPMLAGIVLVLIEERYHAVKLAISIIATLALLLVSVILLAQVDGGAQASIGVYRLGDWPAPFAIVLVADRLAALMVTLSAVLAIAAMTFSAARWHSAGPHFHSLFQLLLMGLNGAFLTGDLFNLFVFFEILLAASYGLALHGSGPARVRAGLHYVAFNLAASSLFLIGVSLIYGVTGTLNMADLATRIAAIPSESRPLFDAGLALLGIAFLVKAGMWPLSFWLPATYGAASAPVAAIFAIMSKVGIYVLLRLSGLLGAELDGFGHDWMFFGGMATMLFGTVGVLSSQELPRMTGFAVLLSSGTVLAMLGYGDPGVTAGAMYYLIASSLGLACLFLLAELMERGRPIEADVFAVTLEAFGDDEVETDGDIGIAVPATMALLTVSFGGCAVLLTGMPPLAGFVGKFAMLRSMLGAQIGGSIPVGTWWLMAFVVLSGLASMIALLRAGINRFWAPTDEHVPRVRVVEMAPIALLLGLGVGLTLLAGPVMGTIQTMSAGLYDPATYIEAVLGSLAGRTP
ncbi:MAG: monovalent cation/H+ antiporter subunit D [Devosia sp.]|jgi:multicomponent K+:H+ antiporter subunit D|nr:monovalent cation/H+ antiporter subunit D [Devosia sp.]